MLAICLLANTNIIVILSTPGGAKQRGKIEYITEAVYQINTFIHTPIRIINTYYNVIFSIHRNMCMMHAEMKH